ncbi:ABC transporter ATP-binding protein [Leucobacter massiliensis]|uniref:ABC transporter ATP-binding protein n=1 Tax=Leucobacter massiliensis TaxID=1686285 RepID=A0A2S9QRS3_9MICO|nr:ABC transporter ATP-binding protein [Leucobacter massiliensis]PRI12297.1 ABC transporter ATP-binding protein [Leucobacter massiliensis]
MHTPLLEAEGLSQHYGPTRALDGVSLAFAAGTSTAVMGASGSGKTTLLHTLAGILVPGMGQVRFGGADISHLGDAERSRLRREHFGFVFQQGLLVPELTAIENVALALMLTGRSKRESLPYAAGWLAALGLQGLEERRIGELSGGQAQRVAIARAQVTGAQIVFADEPTGALDSQTSQEVMQALLAATVGQGRTLVVVTHDREVAAQCQRTVEMRDGRVVRDSAPAGEGPAAAYPAAPSGDASGSWPGAEGLRGER